MTGSPLPRSIETRLAPGERGGRRLSGAGALLALPVFAAWLASLELVVGPGLALLVLAGAPAWLAGALLVGWSGGVVVAYLPGLALVLAQWLLGLGTPTPAERERLERVWGRVCARAGLAPGRFTLRLEPGWDVNALAAGWSLVAITRGALALDEDELGAVLGHELGHHHQGHAAATAAELWYLLPLVALERLLSGLARAVALLGPLALLVELARRLLVAVAVALLAPARLIARLGSRRAEFEADRFSAGLGYARALVSVLARFEAEAAGAGRPGLAEALLATHPEPTDRIRALRGMLGLPARAAR